MNEEVRGILKKAYRGGLSGYEIGTQYEICLLNETEREITTLIKQANNDLAMKLTHEHNRNQELEKEKAYFIRRAYDYVHEPICSAQAGLRKDCHICKKTKHPFERIVKENEKLEAKNERLKKVVEVAKEIKSIREEYRGNIDAEAFYYFGNAVVDLIDSKLNQALKELE